MDRIVLSYKSQRNVTGIIILLFFFLYDGCGYRSIEHEPVKALEKSNQVLYEILKKDYKNAYKSFHYNFYQKVDYNIFRDTIGKFFNENSGGIEKLELDYYRMIPGKGIIEVVYKAHFRKEMKVYIQMLLPGNEKEGYKIIAMNITDKEPGIPGLKVLGDADKLKMDSNIVITEDSIGSIPE